MKSINYYASQTRFDDLRRDAEDFRRARESRPETRGSRSTHPRLGLGLRRASRLARA